MIRFTWGISHSRFCTIFTFAHLLSFLFIQPHGQFAQINSREIGSLQCCIEAMLRAKASLLLQQTTNFNRFVNFNENALLNVGCLEFGNKSSYLFVKYRLNVPHWRKCLFFRHFDAIEFNLFHNVSKPHLTLLLWTHFT